MMISGIALQSPRSSLRSRCLCAVIIGASPLFGYASLAQDLNANQVNIRGFQFDPLMLQNSDMDILDELGIDPGLRAVVPDRSNIAHWRLMQFTRPIDRDLRSRLRSEGLELEMSVDGLYIEQVTLAQVDTLRDSGVLRASVPYHPAFKLSPSIRRDRLHEERVFQTEQRKAIKGLLLRATMFPETDLASNAQAIRAAGGVDVFVQDNRSVGGLDRIVFRLDENGEALSRDLAKIAHLNDVRSIEEVGEIITLNVNATSINQSGNTASATIWDQGLTGDGQSISIFEPGRAATNHCFFTDPSIPDNTPGPEHRKLLEVHDQSQIPADPTDHATFVAASAAGDDYNSPGLHDQRGGAWAAKLVLVNLYDIVEVFGPYSTLLNELDAASQWAHVHSNSWQELHNGYSDYAADFDNFSRKYEGHLVIAAAGKAWLDWGAPAIAKNALTVSAAMPDTTIVGDGYDELPPSGRRKPDLAAVGCEIESATPDSSCGTVFSSGCATSYAAPHAAAIATLARQYFVDGYYRGEEVDDPTGSLLKAIMINSAQDMTGEVGFPSQREGWGILRLDKTLSFSDSEENLWVTDVNNSNSAALDTGEYHDYVVQVNDNVKPLKVTLVWTDSPGDGGGELINDLDLVVITPDNSTTYLGNVFDEVTGASATDGSADVKNNVEQVLVTVPQNGEWTLRVRGSNVGVIETGLYGQGYAMVVTGALEGPASMRRAPLISHIATITDIMRIIIILTISISIIFFVIKRIGRNHSND